METFKIYQTDIAGYPARNPPPPPKKKNNKIDKWIKR